MEVQLLPISSNLDKLISMYLNWNYIQVWAINYQEID